MPFNASGFFQRLFNWRNDRDAGIKILAERMDQELDGIVAGINDIVSGEVDWKGPMTGVYGTAAAPAYSFQEDPNTGVYRVSADVLGFSVGGTKKAEVTATGLNVSGSVTATGLNVSGTTTLDWANVNDGAGSGADADLLDGQHGSYYSGLVTTHESRVDNPHAVTKSQVGLGNADDTSDANKPISTATQTALNGKIARNGDTGVGNLTFSNGSYVRFPHANQQDSNDGVIGSGIRNEGLNIVGAQTIAGSGRKIRTYGDIYMEGGVLSQPDTPAFYALNSQPNHLTGAQKVEFSTIQLNNGSHYSGGSTSRFTAPVAGIYCFYANLFAMNINSGHMFWRFRKNGSPIGGFNHSPNSGSGTYIQIPATIFLSLAAGDYVGVYIGGGSQGIHIGTYNHFGGFLVG